jgi:hypothetical protein
VDLRLEALDLIGQDPVLRVVLANYAHRLEFAGPPSARANEDCFMVLTWSHGYDVHAPTGTQVLTAEVHLPRLDRSGHPCLDMVLQRLAAALTNDAAKRLLTSRWVGRSCRVRDSDEDTVFKSSTFEIAPARSQVESRALLRLAPWPAGADPSSHDLVATSPGSPSLN